MTRRRQAARLAKAMVLVLATAALGHSAQAATQLFKCVIDKRTIYQQQACPVNADPPAAASTPASAASPQVARTAASATARPVRPASRPASSVPATPR